MTSCFAKLLTAWTGESLCACVNYSKVTSLKAVATHTHTHTYTMTKKYDMVVQHVSYVHTEVCVLPFVNPCSLMSNQVMTAEIVSLHLCLSHL